MISMISKAYPVTARDRLLDELSRLHGTSECPGLSWREIAKLPQFRGISFQRLNKIYLTGVVPNDLKKRFKIPLKPQPPEWVSRAADWLAEREQPRNTYTRKVMR